MLFAYYCSINLASFAVPCSDIDLVNCLDDDVRRGKGYHETVDTLRTGGSYESYAKGCRWQKVGSCSMWSMLGARRYPFVNMSISDINPFTIASKETFVDLKLWSYWDNKSKDLRNFVFWIFEMLRDYVQHCIHTISISTTFVTEIYF